MLNPALAALMARAPHYYGIQGDPMMLQRSTGLCGCCGDPRKQRVYQWHAFRYCLTCLHSIGRNAAGNPCTAAQQAAAWREINDV